MLWTRRETPLSVHSAGEISTVREKLTNEGVFRALASSLRVDADSVQASLASLSSKLFVCSTSLSSNPNELVQAFQMLCQVHMYSFLFSVVHLVCENAILTLGGIGVALATSPNVPDLIFSVSAWLIFPNRDQGQIDFLLDLHAALL